MVISSLVSVRMVGQPGRRCLKIEYRWSNSEPGGQDHLEGTCRFAGISQSRRECPDPAALDYARVALSFPSGARIN